ncbi:hypothetical protein ADUPG1_010732, partial [Aduncisulcus paluster]
VKLSSLFRHYTHIPSIFSLFPSSLFFSPSPMKSPLFLLDVGVRKRKVPAHEVTEALALGQKFSEKRRFIGGFPPLSFSMPPFSVSSRLLKTQGSLHVKSDIRDLERRNRRLKRGYEPVRKPLSPSFLLPSFSSSSSQSTVESHPLVNPLLSFPPLLYIECGSEEECLKRAIMLTLLTLNLDDTAAIWNWNYWQEMREKQWKRNPSSCPPPPMIKPPSSHSQFTSYLSLSLIAASPLPLSPVRLFHHVCALTIQKVWRGWHDVRKWRVKNRVNWLFVEKREIWRKKYPKQKIDFEKKKHHSDISKHKTIEMYSHEVSFESPETTSGTIRIVEGKREEGWKISQEKQRRKKQHKYEVNERKREEIRNELIANKSLLLKPHNFNMTEFKKKSRIPSLPSISAQAKPKHPPSPSKDQERTKGRVHLVHPSPFPTNDIESLEAKYTDLDSKSDKSTQQSETSQSKQSKLSTRITKTRERESASKLLSCLQKDTVDFLNAHQDFIKETERYLFTQHDRISQKKTAQKVKQHRYDFQSKVKEVDIEDKRKLLDRICLVEKNKKYTENLRDLQMLSTTPRKYHPSSAVSTRRISSVPSTMYGDSFHDSTQYHGTRGPDVSTVRHVFEQQQAAQKRARPLRRAYSTAFSMAMTTLSHAGGSVDAHGETVGGMGWRGYGRERIQTEREGRKAVVMGRRKEEQRTMHLLRQRKEMRTQYRHSYFKAEKEMRRQEREQIQRDDRRKMIERVETAKRKKEMHESNEKTNWI